MRVLTVIGARPQFVKAAMVSLAIQRWNQVGSEKMEEDLIHTGQHYDYLMSEVFFKELGIPKPAVNLEIGSGGHGETTGKMLGAIEAELLARKPDMVMVYGDTNSTLAGALAASKLGIPIAHVEAGLRSYDRGMPEEINRVLTDHVSTLLLCPTQQAAANLAKEGVTTGVSHVGDVMYDAAVVFGGAVNKSDVLGRLSLAKGGYALCTLHRASNTDDPARLGGILAGLAKVAESMEVLLPLHPRTARAIKAHGLSGACGGIRMVEPVSFMDMVRLEQSCKLIVTDSGGVQKEAYFHGVPCVTVRDNTEWTELAEHGWNQLAAATPEAIVSAVANAKTGTPIPDYGTGNAGEQIVSALASAVKKS